MPWCEDCSKYWAPTALKVDGTCPTCGRFVGDFVGDNDIGDDAADDALDDETTPWHFKLLVVMVIVYLVWRLVQLFT